MNVRLALTRIGNRTRRARTLCRALAGLAVLVLLWLALAGSETAVEWPVWLRMFAGWVAPFLVLVWALAPWLRRPDVAALARALDETGVVVAGLELGDAGNAGRAVFEVGLAARANERAWVRLHACDTEAVVGRRLIKWPAAGCALMLAVTCGLFALAPRLVGTGFARLADPLGDHPVWDSVLLQAQVTPVPDGLRVEAQVDGRGVVGGQSFWNAPPELALVEKETGRAVGLPATLRGVLQSAYARTLRPTAATWACVRLGRARSRYFLVPAFVPPARQTPMPAAEGPSSGHQAGALPAWLAQVANLADALEQLKNKADAARLLAGMAQAAKAAPPDMPAARSLRARLNTPALAGAMADPDATPMALAQAAKSDAKALRALAGTLGHGNGDGGTSVAGEGASGRPTVAPGTVPTDRTVQGKTIDEALLKIKVEQAPPAYRDLVRAYFEALANKGKEK